MHNLSNNGALLQLRPYPKLLSLVIPMFNEESVVPHLRAMLDIFLPEVQCDAEIVLVNDGSADSTLIRILEWCNEDPRVKLINLSRNFGHQSAATAGLDYASGDAVVLMDADLQDPAWVIHKMIGRYCEGYDVVYGQRVVREGESAVQTVHGLAVLSRYAQPGLQGFAG